MIGTVLLGGAVLALARNILRGPRTTTDDTASDAVVQVRKGVAFKALTAILTTLDDLVWVATLKWLAYLQYDSNKMRSFPKPGEEVSPTPDL